MSMINVYCYLFNACITCFTGIHNYKAASQKIFADEGSVVEINCGDGYETDCIIVSPGKDLQQGIVGPCKQNIRIHRTDFGIWICYIGYNSHLLEEVREVEIIDMGRFQKY